MKGVSSDLRKKKDSWTVGVRNASIMTALRPRDRSGLSAGSTGAAKRANGPESPRPFTLHRHFSLPLHRRSLNVQFDPADASDEAWDAWYSRFVSWPADTEGRRLIPSTYETPDGYRIGRWQENQRQAHRRGKLPSSRVARLESAGIVWDALEAAWGEAYYKFLELPPDHRGYRSVAQGYVDKDGFKLGMWQARRKKEEKKEEKKEGSQRPILPPMSRTHLPYTPANVFV
jgi:hypothetical protein